MTNGGESEITVFKSKVVAIHAALLPNGKLFFMSYPSRFQQNSDDSHNHDEHNHEQHQHSHLGSSSSKGAWQFANPENWEEETQGNELEKNLFCAGHCFMDNGELFISGGQYQTLLNPILLFNPPSRFNHTFSKLGQFSQKESMWLGRWYPTCVELADGTVLIISGSWGLFGVKKLGPFNLVHNKLHSYNRDTGLKVMQTLPFKVDLYPYGCLLPDGRVLVHSERTTRFYHPQTNQWEKLPNSNKLLEISTKHEFSRTNPYQGASVLLPLLPDDDIPYSAKIMVAGGPSKEHQEIEDDATNAVEILDLSESDPSWDYTTNMNSNRILCDAVLLPNGMVLVINGCSKGKSDAADPPVLEPDLYDPKTKSWTSLNPLKIGRRYHATALLLPNGKVMTAGTDREWNVIDEDLYDVEVFTPPYLQGKIGPLISNVQSELTIGQEFKIECPQSNEIKSIALIKPGSTTHSLNTDQRFVGLEITNTTQNFVSSKIPTNPNLVPKGYYMLFVMDSDGTPSKAKFVLIK